MSQWCRHCLTDTVRSGQCTRCLRVRPALLDLAREETGNSTLPPDAPLDDVDRIGVALRAEREYGVWITQAALGDACTASEIARVAEAAPEVEIHRLGLVPPAKWPEPPVEARPTAPKTLFDDLEPDDA